MRSVTSPVCFAGWGFSGEGWGGMHSWVAYQSRSAQPEHHPKLFFRNFLRKFIPAWGRMSTQQKSLRAFFLLVGCDWLNGVGLGVGSEC